MTTHAFRHEPRERLTDHERARLFLEKDGRCHKCDRKIEARRGEKWIAEHVHSLGTGGDNRWSNWGLTCFLCLPVKNAEDAAKQAKGRDIAVAEIVPTDQRRGAGGPPMLGSRRSKWKKKMNGKAELR